jgi:hypothetical protein
MARFGAKYYSDIIKFICVKSPNKNLGLLRSCPSGIGLLSPEELSTDYNFDSDARSAYISRSSSWHRANYTAMIGKEVAKSVAKKRNGSGYPPRFYRKAPQRGPKSTPIPFAASIHPMYFSLSACWNVPRTAMLEVARAPAPMPPVACAAKETNKKMSGSLTKCREANPRF